MKFYIHTLGCKVNSADSAELASKLLSNGDSLSTPQQAAVIYVAGCMVTSTAEKKSRKAVNHYKKLNPTAEVIITGCTTSKMGSDPKIDTPDSASEKMDSRAPLAEAALASSRVRPLLKVQDGCNQHCAYCIVCQLRGPLWSLDIGEAVNIAKAYAEQGTAEIVLCGINLGLHDNLLELLEQLVHLAKSDYPNLRFRLSSLEVNHISGDLLTLIAQSDGKICRHLHIPLQAGCDKTLLAMGRPYTTREYLQTIEQARQLMPQIAITTDIIVGFPGESEKDFAKSLQFAEKCAFSKIHVFPFSARSGTAAADMTPKVPAFEISSRALDMRHLSEKLKKRDLSFRSGNTETVVIEQVWGDELWRGKTESYYNVEERSKSEKPHVGGTINYTFVGSDPICDNSAPWPIP